MIWGIGPPDDWGSTASRAEIDSVFPYYLHGSPYAQLGAAALACLHPQRQDILVAQIVQGRSGLNEGEHIIGTGRHTFRVSVTEVTFEGFSIVLVKVDPGIGTGKSAYAASQALVLVDSYHTIG
jgi:hypothetical protein